MSFPGSGEFRQGEQKLQRWIKIKRDDKRGNQRGCVQLSSKAYSPENGLSEL